jgi:hypothetical protein
VQGASARLPDSGDRIGYNSPSGCVAAEPGGAVTEVLKKGLGLLVLAFILFYLLSQPESAAHAVRGATAAIGTGFAKLIRFTAALFH